MTISKFTEPNDFPYGLNIHFAIDVTSMDVKFLHPGFSWILQDVKTDPDLATLKQLIKPDFIPTVEEKFADFIAGRFTGSVIICFKNQRWLRITPHTASKPGDPVLYATLEDITNEMSNDGMLVKYANKKNSILHMLAHDLRGPLGVASALLATMLDPANPNQDVKVSYLSKILAQSVNLIDDLTNREQLDAMEVMLHKKQLNIVKILADYMEECFRSGQLSEREFEFRCDAEEIYIELDNSKFMQVINNVISNALKFTHPGGKIVLAITETDAAVEIKVTDDGIGIPEHLLPVIFEKYTPAARPGLNGEPTIGLGMSIMKLIIDWHEGSVRCESVEGKGTTIFIMLPKESGNA
ncbi:MAG: HAMP domain-containing histidine kinase [Pedobacter sp.]|nr:MAG: HAMP domain-containing histidine kinase [Pedobacter sp.]